jgi:very-short-patch-repair endonuclease
MDAAHLVARHGGALDRRRLHELGATDHDLRRALRAGSLNRPRRGWYSTWAEHDLRFRAMRVGGRLTGISAVAALGGWVLDHHPLHVAVPTNAARLRSQWRRDIRRADARDDGAVVHWVAAAHDRGSSTGMVALTEAIELVCRIEPAEQAIAVLDWARRTGRLDRIELAALRERLGPLCWLVDASVDDCDSMPESLARTRLRAAGLQVSTQVRFTEGPERIDLVLEGAIAVEVDGDEFHRDRFEEDRARDLAITRAGLHALRPSARRVFAHWREVQDAASRALRERGILVDIHNSGVAQLGRPATRRESAPPGVLPRGAPELWRHGRVAGAPQGE